MKTRYTIRQGYPYKPKDAAIIGSFLEKHFPAGAVKAKEVVHLASNPASPIHKYFEWDTRKAAEKYRLGQARKLIKAVCIVVDDHEVPAYHHVFVKESKTNDFVHTDRARDDADLWAQIVDAALREAKTWRSRYHAYKELTLIVQAIDTTDRKYNESSKEAR